MNLQLIDFDQNHLLLSREKTSIGFELQGSPEQSVMHKNGFAKLATLCGVNLCVEKTLSKRNIKEKKKIGNLMNFGSNMKKIPRCYALKQEWSVLRLLVR